MIEIIKKAVSKGAKVFSSVSGGKDSDAMTKTLLNNGFQVESLVHADLGRIEWKESLVQCDKLSSRENIPLVVVTRKDKRDMVDHWKHRWFQLKGTGKPFWSSSSNRYCTSDLKRDPINLFFTSTGFDFIICCTGIRAEESPARAKKNPLTIRRGSSTYYKGMTVEEAVENFKPGKRLMLDWFPIFNFSLEDVWNTYGNTGEELKAYQVEFRKTRVVNENWKFHPAYVYGNERVSCMFCVLASHNDLLNGKEFNPEVWKELVEMEKESGFTFRTDFSLEKMEKIPGKKARLFQCAA